MIFETRIGVRMESELREKLEKLATEDRRTLSGYILKVLQDHVAEREKPKRKG